MAKPYKISDTGNAAIDVTVTVPEGRAYKLLAVSCHFSAAPSTSESLTVTMDADEGSAYDTALYTVNPSTEAA